jgi:hypothetical protein
MRSRSERYLNCLRLSAATPGYAAGEPVFADARHRQPRGETKYSKHKLPVEGALGPDKLA